MKLIIDPEFESLIFPLTEEEFKGLEQDIISRGKCYDSIKVWQPNKLKEEYIIVDGHHRYKICQKYKITNYRISILEFENREEVKDWIIKNQLNRRNLNDFQRIELALKLKNSLTAQAKKNLKTAKPGTRGGSPSMNSTKAISTRKKIAKMADVSEDSVRKSEIILNEAPEQIKNEVREGKESINAAYKSLNKPRKRTMTAQDCYGLQYGHVDMQGNFTKANKVYFIPPEDSQEGIDTEWIDNIFKDAIEEIVSRYEMRKKLI